MVAAAHSAGKPVIGFHFLAVPVALVERTDLSPAAKLLAGVILDSARGSKAGSCRLCNSTLATRIGVSVASVKRLLAELETAGVICRETIAGGRIRTAIRPTWVDQIRSTEQASADQDQPRGGADSSHPLAHGRATIQTPGSEPGIQTSPILSTQGEKTSDEPVLTAEQTAEYIRAMRDGTFKPILAGAVPGGGRAVSPVPSPAEKSPRIEKTETYPPEVRTMFGRVGYSARAAAFRPLIPRKTPAQVMDDLRRASAAREREGVGLIRPG